MSVKKVKLLQDVIGDRGREGIAGGGGHAGPQREGA